MDRVLKLVEVDPQNKDAPGLVACASMLCTEKGMFDKSAELYLTALAVEVKVTDVQLARAICSLVRHKKSALAIRLYQMRLIDDDCDFSANLKEMAPKVAMMTPGRLFGILQERDINLLENFNEIDKLLKNRLLGSKKNKIYSKILLHFATIDDLDNFEQFWKELLNNPKHLDTFSQATAIKFYGRIRDFEKMEAALGVIEPDQVCHLSALHAYRVNGQWERLEGLLREISQFEITNQPLAKEIVRSLYSLNRPDLVCSFARAHHTIHYNDRSRDIILRCASKMNDHELFKLLK